MTSKSFQTHQKFFPLRFHFNILCDLSDEQRKNQFSPRIWELFSFRKILDSHHVSFYDNILQLSQILSLKAFDVPRHFIHSLLRDLKNLTKFPVWTKWKMLKLNVSSYTSHIRVRRGFSVLIINSDESFSARSSHSSRNFYSKCLVWKSQMKTLSSHFCVRRRKVLTSSGIMRYELSCGEKKVVKKNQQKILTEDKTKDKLIGKRKATWHGDSKAHFSVFVSFAWINGFLLSAKKPVELPFFFGVIKQMKVFQFFSSFFLLFRLSSRDIPASLISRLTSDYDSRRKFILIFSADFNIIFIIQGW